MMLRHHVSLPASLTPISTTETWLQHVGAVRGLATAAEAVSRDAVDEHLVLPVIRGVHLGQKLLLGAAQGNAPVFVDLETK